MKKILKIEAFSGASGDMFLGALAGLLNAYDELVMLPQMINFEKEAEIRITDVKKSGIVCKQVKVVDLVHEHHHRHLTDIIKIINASGLTESAKKIAFEIFQIIGKAEAEVHGIPIEKIHFHEVGAVDSIIDICGAAYLLDKLKIDETYLTTLVTGKGFVKTAHGMLPVPCPATKLITEGIPYILGDEEGEKLTPTGAAIIKYLNPKFEQVPMKDKATAYGVGEKEFKSPNLLRLSICEILENNESEMFVIEANIDDANSEFLGVEFQDKLLEVGAVDFFMTPIIMKKGRPAVLLSIFCGQKKINDISTFIFSFTSTIGLRYYKVGKKMLKREIKEVETEYGRFRIKITTMPDGTEKVKPESSDVLKYCLENKFNPINLTHIIVGSYENDK